MDQNKIDQNKIDQNKKHYTNSIHTVSNTILYELWFSVAEKLFDKVCEVTDLDEDQITALRSIALRPNDFQVIIE